MGFIEIFFKKNPKDITKEDVELFISKRIEENLNLDYKDIKAYDHFDELAKDISAFANSDGGLIILGVSEERVGEGKKLKIFPKEITWGDENLSREKLEDNIIAKIHPRIEGLRIVPVREGDSSSRVIFLIDVPKSSAPPHMASDHRYWKRLNFRRVEMEHYEIVDIFKARWVMREKLIENIYEPLASILEKHTKDLERFSVPSAYEIEEVLSRTYYKMQMDVGLWEELDDYIDQIKSLRKKELYISRLVSNIIKKNVLAHLGGKYPQLRNKLEISLKVTSEREGGTLDLHPQLLLEILLKNQTIKERLIKEYFGDIYEYNKMIVIIHDEITPTKKHYIDLDKFDEHIWKKCIKEASENDAITQFKESIDGLIEYAWNIIEEIVEY